MMDGRRTGESEQAHIARLNDEIEQLRKKVEVSETDRIDSCIWWSDLADAMNDEIERLRGIINDDRLEGAADEIERLRKQNAVLQTELALVRSMLPNVKAYQTGTGDFTPLKDKE